MECREDELFMKVAVTDRKRTSRALGDVCTTSNLANMKTGQTTPTVSALPVRLQRLGGTTPSKPLSFSTASRRSARDRVFASQGWRASAIRCLYALRR
jgi:hypothetical protein